MGTETHKVYQRQEVSAYAEHTTREVYIYAFALATQTPRCLLLVFMETTIVKNYSKLYKCQFDILIDFDSPTHLPLTLILMVISTGLFNVNGGSSLL